MYNIFSKILFVPLLIKISEAEKTDLIEKYYRGKGARWGYCLFLCVIEFRLSENYKI